MGEEISGEEAKPRSQSLVQRRTALASAVGIGASPLLSQLHGAAQEGPSVVGQAGTSTQSQIGVYGEWAAQLAPNPPRLSLRGEKNLGMEDWRKAARTKTAELIASPEIGEDVEVQVVDRQRVDGLDIEKLSWQLPFGGETKAVLLKPSNASGPFPGVLGLHDHGGNKYFGHRKITRTADKAHPSIVAHQKDYYGGRAWANELARRGYAVLVHDTFTFGSRRVRLEDISDIAWGPCKTEGLDRETTEDPDSIRQYNDWASHHEHILAKSLFCAGTTWPGVYLAEDQAALGVLAARPEVDASRLGCAGLSGGGLRTVYLGGMDSRIRCAVCVGFMSTWSDFLLNTSFTHTWMTYTPLLPNYLEFPEVLGLRVPMPTMTLNCKEDPLYTLPKMKEADKILREVFALAGADEQFSSHFYDGGHKFDLPMQEEAFKWFQRWL